jgi:hypothetical protein
VSVHLPGFPLLFLNNERKEQLCFSLVVATPRGLPRSLSLRLLSCDLTHVYFLFSVF